MIGSILGRDITNNIKYNSCKDRLFLSAIILVDFVNRFGLNSVLEGGFQVKLQTIISSALDHGKSGLTSLWELNGLEIDLISLEIVAKSNEMYTIWVSLIFNGLKPITVVESDFSVAQHR